MSYFNMACDFCKSLSYKLLGWFSQKMLHGLLYKFLATHKSDKMTQPGDEGI